MSSPGTTASHVAWQFTLATAVATQELGQAIGRALRPGDHFGLTGGLGAGKTTLCRAVAQGFGVLDLDEVASPTYAYAHTYRAKRGPLHHLDFYRLETAESAYALGLDDILAEADGACLIEWADRVVELVAPKALWLHLQREPRGQSPEYRIGHLDIPTADVDYWQAIWPQAVPRSAVPAAPGSR